MKIKEEDRMIYYDRLHVKRISVPEALKEGPVFVTGVCDCFTAEIAENAGYKAVCLMGEDVAAYFAGVPDIGLLTPTEFRIVEGEISKVINIPAIVDMENGFGNEMNAIRAAIDLIEAGAMAVVMNDQVFPNRYGNENAERYLCRDEYYNKCRAVADTLKGSEAVLIAKIDSYEELGLEETVKRANRAIEAGAYAVWISEVHDKGIIREIGEMVQGKKMFGMSRGWKKRSVSYEELVDMGYSIVYCPTFLDAAHCAYNRQLTEVYRLKSDSFVDPVDIINGVERREFLGLNKWLEKGKEYNTEINIASKTKALD